MQEVISEHCVFVDSGSKVTLTPILSSSSSRHSNLLWDTKGQHPLPPRCRGVNTVGSYSANKVTGNSYTKHG